MEWITLAQVLELPYGTKLERYESHCIYEMRQELVILNDDKESGVDYPSIDKELLNAKFKIIKPKMDRMLYLMERYETDDISILNCRVPFDYKDTRYDRLEDEEYIAMIDRLEDIENEDIYRVLKERGNI